MHRELDYGLWGLDIDNWCHSLYPARLVMTQRWAMVQLIDLPNADSRIGGLGLHAKYTPDGRPADSQEFIYYRQVHSHRLP